MPDDPYREKLTPAQYRVLRERGTERPFTGAYHDCHDPGTYHCPACDAALFGAAEKYDSGTGWPSFFAPVAGDAVRVKRDWSLLIPRREVVCANCGSHLGHVFRDGPQPTGERYCINSAALRLQRGD